LLHGHSNNVKVGYDIERFVHIIIGRGRYLDRIAVVGSADKVHLVGQSVGNRIGLVRGKKLSTLRQQLQGDRLVEVDLRHPVKRVGLVGQKVGQIVLVYHPRFWPNLVPHLSHIAHDAAWRGDAVAVLGLLRSGGGLRLVYHQRASRKEREKQQGQQAAYLLHSRTICLKVYIIEF